MASKTVPHMTAIMIKPIITHMVIANLPRMVRGWISPYPTVVMDTKLHHIASPTPDKKFFSFDANSSWEVFFGGSMNHSSMLNIKEHKMESKSGSVQFEMP